MVQHHKPASLVGINSKSYPFIEPMYQMSHWYCMYKGKESKVWPRADARKGVVLFCMNRNDCYENCPMFAVDMTNDQVG